MTNIMKLLVVGDDPQVLTLAYYVLTLNPDIDVTVCYTREDKPFRDVVLELSPVHSERLILSLGGDVRSLSEANLDNFDLIVDVMSYSIKGEIKDHVLGVGTVETAIAAKRDLRIIVPENTDLLDGDVLKYLAARLGDKIEISGRSTGGDTVTVRYGVKHLEHPKCKYVGYGYRLRFIGTELEVTDPAYVYRQCIAAGVAIAMNIPLDDVVGRAPYWRSVLARDYACLVLGPTSSQIVKTGKTVTSIPLTVDKCYLKLLCLYRQNIVGAQVVGPVQEVQVKAEMMYSLVVSTRDYSVLSRLVFYPTLPTVELRGWVDMLIESSLKEMYWLFYTG